MKTTPQIIIALLLTCAVGFTGGALMEHSRSAHLRAPSPVVIWRLQEAAIRAQATGALFPDAPVGAAYFRGREEAFIAAQAMVQP